MNNIDHKKYQATPNILKDRVILVTGAGDGIGRACAKSFAEYGATVVLLGRTVSKLETLHDEILEAGLAQPGIVPMDLSKAMAPEYLEMKDSLEKAYGCLHGLLHNASILGERAPIEHQNIAIWHEVMHVNLTAPFVLTQVLFPLLRDSEDASVVFTSSGVGRKGRAFWGAYAVSKFGTEGLSQILADETSEAGIIRVNCINPGKTRTKMRRTAYPVENVNTLVMPEEIMAPYLYLMGPDSRGVTGQSIDCQ